MAEANCGRVRVCRRGWGRGVDPEEDEPPNRRRDQRDREIAAKRRRIRELERQLAEARTGSANGEEEVQSEPLDSSAEGDDDEGFNQWVIPNQRNRRPGLKPNISYQTLGMKIDLPEFEGISHPDEFIDWLRTVERVFDVKNLNDGQKVKLVAFKLRKHASIWWEHVKTKRVRDGKPEIRSWSKMKKKLIARFLPTQYRQEAFVECHNLKQRGMSVEQYANEFDMLRMRCDVVEEDVDPVYDDYEDYDEGLEDHLTEGEEITYADSGESLVVRSGIAEAIILATDEIAGHVRNKDAVVHSYNNGFSGFAASLSEAESNSIAQRPGVTSVFPEVVITSGGSDNSSTKGADTIIGILDTRIGPETESFNDNDMSEVPSRWKGTCMISHDSSSFKCNKKLVGARFYGDDDEDGVKPSGSARDQNGHGTHVASTAAGSQISGASYYGLGSGIVKDGSPGSRMAMYRACTDGGCHKSSIAKAFDDAIADGVNVLSLSLGSLSGLQAEFLSDPIAIGAFQAVEKEILVAYSAGNQGPQTETVVNVVPWILTVAATTIDRDFETHIVLGGNKVLIKGGGISFGNLTSSPMYPLITGDLAKSADSDVSRYCLPDSVGIFAISHNCSGVAARTCGLASLEPTKIAEVLKDRPSWFRDCRKVKVFIMFSAGSGGTVELLFTPSGYLIRPYDGGGSIIHIVDRKLRAVNEIEPALKDQLITSTALMTIGIAIVSWTCLLSSITIFNFGTQKVVKNWQLFLCVGIGLWDGLIIGFVTEYYTSNAYSPVQDVANSCRTGAAKNVIFGLALGYKSVIIPTFAIAIAIFVSFSFASMYGITVAALGMLNIQTRKSSKEQINTVVHPIFDETFYLSTEHKWRLKKEYGIEPWTFLQNLGEAVFVPAGCPYQVRNLESCINVTVDFISPENVNECIRLTEELHKLPRNHVAREDKLGVKKIIVHAMSQAVDRLEKTLLPGISKEVTLSFQNIENTAAKKPVQDTSDVVKGQRRCIVGGEDIFHERDNKRQKKRHCGPSELSLEGHGQILQRCPSSETVATSNCNLEYKICESPPVVQSKAVVDQHPLEGSVWCFCESGCNFSGRCLDPPQVLLV